MDLSTGLDERRLRGRSPDSDDDELSIVMIERPAGLPVPSARTAVLLPCRNEARTIAKVVTDFQAALPNAAVYVYDNASTDNTAERAARAGAVVRYVPEPGKGNVLRRMFSEVEADVYVLADGDDTYEATRAPELVRLLTTRGLDMVVGSRVEQTGDSEAFRPGHRLGNRLFNGSVRALFGERPTDMLSGYRVFSRRFAKSFPAMARGFEIETEITLHALDLRLPILEVPTAYSERPPDSASKLRTIRDGIRILKFLITLVHAYRPMMFYSALGVIFGLAAAVMALFGNANFSTWSGFAVAVVGLGSFGAACVLAGACLEAIRRGQREMKRMIYLSASAAAGPIGCL